MYVLWNRIGEYYRLSNGTPKLFVTKDEATQYSNHYLTFPDRWEIREWDIAPWRVQARTALHMETVTPPVWQKENWFLKKVEEYGHYPVVSPKDAMLIDFFPTPEKGEKGQVTSIKAGRYLKQFYGDVLDEAAIKKWSSLHKETYIDGPGVKWATTPEEIEAVYSLPAHFSSCMQHRANHWTHGIHPTRAYGAGDLSVAYLTKNDALTARAVVWKDKQKVGRVYGDGELLRAGLKREGIITQSNGGQYDNFEGAKMLYIPYGSRTENGQHAAVLPYIDSPEYTGLLPDLEDDTKLVITKNTVAKYNAIDQNGRIRPTAKCAGCNNYQARDVVIDVPGFNANTPDIGKFTHLYCHTCAANSELVYVDAAFNRYMSRKVYTPIPFHQYGDGRRNNNAFVTKEALSRYHFISDMDGEAYRNEEKFRTPEGKTISTYQRDRGYTKSQYDNVYYTKDMMRQLGDKFYTRDQYNAVVASANDLFLRHENDYRYSGDYTAL